MKNSFKNLYSDICVTFFLAIAHSIRIVYSYLRSQSFKAESHPKAIYARASTFKFQFLCD